MDGANSDTTPKPEEGGQSWTCSDGANGPNTLELNAQATVECDELHNSDNANSDTKSKPEGGVRQSWICSDGANGANTLELNAQATVESDVGQMIYDKNNLPGDVLLLIFKSLIPKKSPDEYFTRKDFGIIRCHVAPVCKRFYALCDQLSMFKQISYEGDFKKAEFDAFCQFATSPSSVTNAPRIEGTKKFSLKITAIYSGLIELRDSFTLANPAVCRLFTVANQLWHLDICVYPVVLPLGCCEAPPYHTFLASVNSSTSNVLPALTSLKIDPINGLAECPGGGPFPYQISLKGFKHLEKLSWMSTVDSLDPGWLKEHLEAGGKLKELSINTGCSLYGECLCNYIYRLASAIRDYCPHLESLLCTFVVDDRSGLASFLTQLVKDMSSATLKRLEIFFHNTDDSNEGVEYIKKELDEFLKEFIASIPRFPSLATFVVTGNNPDKNFFEKLKKALPNNIQVVENKVTPYTIYDFDDVDEGVMMGQWGEA